MTTQIAFEEISFWGLRGISQRQEDYKLSFSPRIGGWGPNYTCNQQPQKSKYPTTLIH